MSKAEADKQTPPSFIRYRFAATLDTQKPPDTESTPNENTTTELLSPGLRYRKLLNELVTFLHSIDRNSIIISWNNNDSFTNLSTNPSQFPTEIKDISTFFSGFHSKLK